MKPSAIFALPAASADNAPSAILGVVTQPSLNMAVVIGANTTLLLGTFFHLF
jgi:hypothetical protein